MFLFGGWGSSSHREARALRRALAEISDKKTPVRVEVEGTGIRFLTVVLLHRNALVIVKPSTLRADAPRNSIARVTLPGRERLQVRCRVQVPRFTLAMSGRHAIICTVPETFAGTCQRAADRFDTSRYKALRLHVPTAQSTFSVVDVSQAGLRIVTRGAPAGEVFKPGAELAPARLLLGYKVKVDLASLVPRNQADKAIGLQMRVQEDPFSLRYWQHFLKQLEQQERLRLRTDTF